MTGHIVTRTHEFSYGHRVAGHECKCKHLHGHNAKVEFVCTSIGVNKLDRLGRVIDFGVLKDRLCAWLEENWDHKMLLWAKDPILPVIYDIDDILSESIVVVPFNPTAENMAQHLVDAVGPHLLPEGIVLTQCTVWETTKCSATYTRTAP